MSGDKEILDLCTRAIQAEGEEFHAIMAELRKLIWRTSHRMENATLASVLKLSRVVQASKKASAEEDDKEQQKVSIVTRESSEC